MGNRYTGQTNRYHVFLSISNRLLNSAGDLSGTSHSNPYSSFTVTNNYGHSKL
ncbi:unnamed protein product [marine sediment metagenome]|uniref:Uncharacterized protein n=1 Tax=marine sediment metagenome TaxID=412755 RepID=X1TLE0_9ZZZZ